jgi:hypothetical protein
LTALALRESGVPVLAVSADMVDDQNWSHGHRVSLIEEFLRSEGLIA